MTTQMLFVHNTRTNCAWKSYGQREYLRQQNLH